MAALVAWTLATGCPATPPARHFAKPTLGRAFAERLLAAAPAAEPVITNTVRELARRWGARLFKPEHRLKTRASLLRKVDPILRRTPELALDRVRITDALRFTVHVEDRPPGRHVRAVSGTLAALERIGHRVEEVKNYWPRGDNYSGVNGVLRTPAGLLWELQFHTADSLRVNQAQRAHYEELRRVETPLARRRALFAQMARAWEAVPLPKGILNPGALHQREKVVRLPPP